MKELQRASISYSMTRNPAIMLLSGRHWRIRLRPRWRPKTMISITQRSYCTQRSLVFVAAALTCGALMSGCRNDAGTFSAVGAGLGAATGAIIGHQSGHGGEGALIGLGAGALGGYILGNESDKHKAERYNPNYDY